ncbi:MAG: CotH kinase family protein [Fibrobacter sp.]|nr:CotH kinase family protein [Fibrobacter sp.]
MIGMFWRWVAVFVWCGLMIACGEKSTGPEDIANSENVASPENIANPENVASPETGDETTFEESSSSVSESKVETGSKVESSSSDAVTLPFRDLLPNNGIPYIRITVPDSAALNDTTENGEAVYSEAVIEIAGNGLYGDVPAMAGKVRYRGNSTRLWYPKKPYRIKFSEKTEVLGLAANKDWVLLANYRDQSKFMNAVVFDMARNMGNFKFVNANRFVEVEVNGDYKGIYQLTEQIEQAADRVNIDKTTGVLFNMDKDDGPELNTWDNNNFWSSVYKLPMAVKYPKDVTAAALETIQADFAKVEQAVADGDFATFSALMDVATFMDYLIIQEVTRNVEIEAPRSTYLYKESAEGKYAFGPIWDYDGGFGYSWNEDTFQYFSEDSWVLSSGNPSKSPYNCVAANMSDWGTCNTSSSNAGDRGGMGGFGGGFGPGGSASSWNGYGESGFFTNLFANEEFLAAYKARWNELKDVLYNYATGELDGYLALCKNALDNDVARWNPKRSYTTDIASLKSWLQKRIANYTSVVAAY